MFFGFIVVGSENVYFGLFTQSLQSIGVLDVHFTEIVEAYVTVGVPVSLQTIGVVFLLVKVVDLLFLFDLV